MSFLIELCKIPFVMLGALSQNFSATLFGTEVYMIAPGQKAAMIVEANFRDPRHKLTAIF
jgi:hypothetical protein